MLSLEIFCVFCVSKYKFVLFYFLTILVLFRGLRQPQSNKHATYLNVDK